jgi:hypothetical protein
LDRCCSGYKAAVLSAMIAARLKSCPSRYVGDCFTAVPSLRDLGPFLSGLPRTSVLGYCLPPLRGLSRFLLRPPRLAPLRQAQGRLWAAFLRRFAACARVHRFRNYDIAARYTWAAGQPGAAVPTWVVMGLSAGVSQNGNLLGFILRRAFPLANRVWHSANGGRNRRGPCGPRFYLWLKTFGTLHFERKADSSPAKNAGSE